MHLIGKVKVALILWLAALLPATAQDGVAIRADDAARLQALDASIGSALRQALADGDAADIRILVAGLEGAPLPTPEAARLLPGEWQCQTIKIGRILPLVVYQPFRCHAGPDGSFEKLTGSQRTRGQAVQLGDQLIYLGTGFVAGEEPPPYADLPPVVDPQAVPQFMPQIGVIELTGPDRGRIIFPRPHLESETDILLLSR